MTTDSLISECDSALSMCINGETLTIEMVSPRFSGNSHQRRVKRRRWARIVAYQDRRREAHEACRAGLYASSKKAMQDTLSMYMLNQMPEEQRELAPLVVYS